MRPTNANFSKTPLDDFSQNLNPFPFASSFFPRNELLLLEKYPEPYGDVARQATANFLGVPVSSVGLGAGATQILFELPRLISYERAVIPTPTFWEYEFLNERHQKTIVTFPLSEELEFDLQCEELEKILQPGDAVFICNINNPTSRIIDATRLLSLVRKRPDVFFVVDETYLLFLENFNAQTLSSSAPELTNLIVVISLSKFLRVPGIRVGCFIAHPSLIRKYYEKLYVPFSLNHLCDKFVPDFLSQTTHIEKSRRAIARERDRVCMYLAEHFSDRIKVIPPIGNFVLIKLLTGQKDHEIADALFLHNILIRKGSDIAMAPEWIRFCINTKSNNTHLLSALNSVVFFPS